MARLGSVERRLGPVDAGSDLMLVGVDARELVGRVLQGIPGLALVTLERLEQGLCWPMALARAAWRCRAESIWSFRLAAPTSAGSMSEFPTSMKLASRMTRTLTRADHRRPERTRVSMVSDSQLAAVVAAPWAQGRPPSRLRSTASVFDSRATNKP